MNLKKMLMATAAGFMVMFGLAGLWHMLLMADFYQDHTLGNQLTEPQAAYIALGYLVLALLMSYVYPVGYKGGSAVSEGLKFGLVMGLIWVLPHGLVMHGVVESSAQLLVIDSIWHLAEEGIGGIVIGLVYGKVS